MNIGNVFFGLGVEHVLRQVFGVENATVVSKAPCGTRSRISAAGAAYKQQQNRTAPGARSKSLRVLLYMPGNMRSFVKKAAWGIAAGKGI